MTNEACAEAMIEIGRQINTQDNQYTADPFCLVEEKKRIYGIDTDYDPEIAWLYADESVEVPAEEAARLEEAYKTSYDLPEGYRRVGYMEEWRYVTGFFTVEGAESYIRKNGHRHSGELRTYVDSLYRNPEMIAVRAHLSKLGQLK